MLQKGFTLIELMIVVAIIGILSMFALPAYQDYTKRTYVSEGIALSSGAKLAATEYYSTQGEWPASNAIASLAPTITGQSVDNIQVSTTGTASAINAGRITISYNSRVAAGATLLLASGGTSGGSFEWKCSGSTNANGIYVPTGGTASGLEAKWLPANCRQDVS